MSNMAGKDVADTTTETINETTIVEDKKPTSRCYGSQDQ